MLTTENEEFWTAEREGVYKAALGLVVKGQKVSISLLQRKLSIGYLYAGRLLERMEKDGYIGSFEGSMDRKIFITQAQYDEKYPD